MNISFLVITESLNQTILGINAIKILVQLNDNLELLHEIIYQSVGNKIGQDNVRAFVDLIQSTKEQENIAVKSKREGHSYSSRQIGTDQLKSRCRIH